MTTTPPLGATVEIVEPWSERTGSPPPDALPCIKPYRVRVNGTDVGLIAKNGIRVDTGDNTNPATVTLTLQPRSVTVKAE